MHRGTQRAPCAGMSTDTGTAPTRTVLRLDAAVHGALTAVATQWVGRLERTQAPFDTWYAFWAGQGPDRRYARLATHVAEDLLTRGLLNLSEQQDAQDEVRRRRVTLTPAGQALLDQLDADAAAYQTLIYGPRPAR